jgi:prephenate dehydratase
MDKKIIVQGYHGCFHEEAAKKYFGQSDLEITPTDTFPLLAKRLVNNPGDHLAIIAIENSIAGSLLQNYRLLRENHLRVIGEVYLRIEHNLMALRGQRLSDISEVISHPMAINQCLEFFNDFPKIKLVEAADTALSARKLRDGDLKGTAAIASKVAAEIYDLEILAPGIETSDMNYTRFFIVQDATQTIPNGNFDKASVYLRVPHARGSLLKVLEIIHRHGINMSKLQSFPVLGIISEYYFHIDLEFEKVQSYRDLIEELQNHTTMMEILGVYKRASIYDSVTV